MNCPECGSLNTKKNGFRPLAKGKKQRYSCKDCKKKFSDGCDVGGNPKILYFDIETSKVKVEKALWPSQINKEVFVSYKDIEQDWFVFGWAAKWLCSKDIYSEVLTPNEVKNCNDVRVVKKLWKYFDEADIIIGHNSNGFDIKKMNWRFIKHGMMPPSHYNTVDTLLVARRVSGATSKSMEFLAKELGLNGGKGEMKGEDWDACMEGNPKALKKLRAYNEHDVVVGESIYFVYRPWDRTHHNLGMYYETDELRCRNCGSVDVIKDGTYNTPVRTYIAWRCECGANGRTDEMVDKGKKLLK